MRSSWQSQTGRLTLYWSEVRQSDPYKPNWMLETSPLPSGYLPSDNRFRQSQSVWRRILVPICHVESGLRVAANFFIAIPDLALRTIL